MQILDFPKNEQTPYYSATKIGFLNEKNNS
jgi:hypothetical protein